MPRKGFTLIEILVAIAIIGILSTVVLASVNAARERARMTAGKQLEATIHRAAGDRAEVLLNFDECSGSVAQDSSGSGKNGTLVNGPTWSTDTPSGSGCSLSFNGTNNYVSVPAINIGTGPVTFSAWVKGTSVPPAQERGIFSVGGGVNDWHFTFERSSSGRNIIMYVGFGVQTPDSLVGGNWPVGNTDWHHVAMTRSATSMKLYFDGVQVASSNSANFTNYNAGNGVIRIGYPSATYWAGLIDNARIYTSTLSIAEIQQLYAEEAANRFVLTTVPGLSSSEGYTICML